MLAMKVSLDERRRAAIEQIVGRLVEQYQPQCIVLFGSSADGEPDEDSDIDLLIVKETADRWLDRLATVRRLVGDPTRRIPFDPLILTPAEVEQRLRMGDQFIAEILEHGRILYPASRVDLPGRLAPAR
jgi:predicted nucleotidyltransferase